MRIKFFSKRKEIYREAVKDAKEIFNFWYLTEGSLALLRDLRLWPRFRKSRLRLGGSKVLVPACPACGLVPLDATVE